MIRLAAAALALAAATAAVAAPVTLQNAWMRPAVEGADARAYVDIVSDANVDLVGAATPVAKKVVIVRVRTIGDPSTEQVVKTLPAPGGTTTRLAYHGDHLRLVGLKRPVGNSDPVPLKLTFKDRAGKRFDVETSVLVRGLLVPQLMPESSRDAPAQKKP